MKNDSISSEAVVAAVQNIKERDYWLNQLSGHLEKTVFPYDQQEPGGDQGMMASEHFKFSPQLYSKLMKITNRSDPRLHIVLAAGLTLLLDRYMGSSDIIVGTPIYTPEVEGKPINTVLALRNQVRPDMPFKKFLLQVARSVFEANENQNFPLDVILPQLNISMATGETHQHDFPLFDVALVLTNIQARDHIRHIKLNMVFSFSKTDEGLEGIVEYNASLYKKTTLERMMGHFCNLMDNIVSNVDLPVSVPEILTADEKNRLLYDFNDTAAAYPADKTLHRLFEEQVEKSPNKIAVTGCRYMPLSNMENIQLTYDQLNGNANHMARRLIQKGVAADTIAAVMVERSVEMMVALFGILKAGGAYLPIEPDYPEERKRYMLADSHAKVLVLDVGTGPCCPESLDACWQGEPILIIQNNEGDESTHRKFFNKASAPAAPGNLAYVIYTSGTTGKPKGTLIQHGNVVRLIFNEKNLFDFNRHHVWTMFHSYCFDFSVWEMYGALLNGGKLILLPKMVTRDPGTFLQVLKEEAVTVLNQTPSAFYQLIDEELKCSGSPLPLRYVIFGGEALKPIKLGQWKERYPGVKLVNMYGITETTVHVTYKEIGEKEIQANISNIGVPIPTLSTYVMDRELNLAPLGAPGEACIGGEGVARGYLNRPELTAAKFVHNPYKTGEKLYRSGDRVKLSGNGEMQYLGRIDQQVKIRGFRIEPGEIENKLLNHPHIREVVVITKGEAEERYLCAYFVSDREFELAQLRDHLSRELPQYMVPAYFVKLDRLPLTVNGKIDRSGLPEPAGIDLGSQADYVPPANDLEKQLAAIWEQVLGREPIGINDNFFEIGGDSIKSIQISAKLNREGYKVKVIDIFQNPTISGLVPLLVKNHRIPDQSLITGEIPLTPIQHWFFNHGFNTPGHFNQAVMFYCKEGFEPAAVEAVLLKLQEHHDALRMVFKEENGKMIQVNCDLDYPFSLPVFDYRNQADAAAALAAKVNEIQADIDLNTGPLMKPALFHLEDGDRLLLVIHHLVIDGVSWRIIFEDLGYLYQQYQKGEALTLPLKTDSFKTWAEKLYQYANTKEFLKEKSYWERWGRTAAPGLKMDFQEEDNYVKDVDQLSFSLDEAETALLLEKVNEAFGTEINDILLTALGLAVKNTWHQDHLLIALEGHGREEILPDVDISRTIGWFTSLYPVLLDFSYENHLARQIKEVKENLRRIPHNGIGYGILKYLTGQTYKDESHLQFEPQISFNYLGQFDADLGQMSWEMAPGPTGNNRDLEERREYVLDVSGMIAKKQLLMSMVYSKKQYKAQTIKTLLNHFKTKLRLIISYCAARKDKDLTPSDLTYPGLSIETLERLKKEYPLEDIYPLTPMQEGMLFYGLYAANTSAYFTQVSFRLQGELNVDYVEKSLNELLKRYQVLRTVFVHEGLEHPLQLVLKERQVDFYYEDISEMSQEDKEVFIKGFKEKNRQRLFDLSRDVLMRVTVIRLSRGQYEFIWNKHHIILDGWCFSILISEYFEIYKSYLENRAHRLPPVKPYRTYIQWLQKQNKEDSRKYWAEYLFDYQEVAGLPENRVHKTGREVYKNQDIIFHLEKGLTDSLNQLASKNQVTLNSVIKVLWGIILAKYNHKPQPDVLFGAVVSGRPAEIDGIETMVGLFINTVPVRVKYDKKTRFNELLNQVQKESQESEPYHYSPIGEIQAGSGMKKDLLNHILVFENYPVAARLDGVLPGSDSNNNKDTQEHPAPEVFEQSNYDFNLVVSPGKQVKINFKYNGNVYDKALLKKLELNIKEVIARVAANPGIGIDEIAITSDFYPASPAQEDLYHALRRENRWQEGHMLTLWPLPGELESGKVEQIFQQLIARHENLRTTFGLIGDRLMRRLHHNNDVEFFPAYFEAKEEQIPRILKDFIKPFDLTRPPLMNVGIVKTGETGQVLLLNTHRLAADSVSHQVLMEEFAALSGEKVLPALQTQYNDYVVWQKSREVREAASKQEGYWLTEFSQQIPPLKIPTDYAPGTTHGFKPGTFNFNIAAEHLQTLKKIAKQQGAALDIVLITLFYILLSKITGQDDIVMGTVAAGRIREEYRQVIGLFENPLALRNYPRHEKSFIDFLTEVKARTADAAANQDYRFERLLEKLAVINGTYRNSLFDVMFYYHNYRNGKHPGAEQGLMAPIFNEDYNGTNHHPAVYHPLYALQVFETAAPGIELRFVYDGKRFNPETIQRFAGYFKEIVSVVARDKNIKLGSISISHRLLSAKLNMPQSDFAF
ncbi:MAG: amino acid adenylation domain-containing protein [Candidatus Aminicenantes bacterium]